MRTILRRLAADTRYTLLCLPLSVVGFVLVVAGLALGAGLLPVVLGLPVAAVTLRAARGIASVDRAWLTNVLVSPPAPPGYRSAPAGAGAWRRLTDPLRCAQSWFDALGAVLRLPVAVAGFAVAVTWWSLTLGGLLYPVYGPVTARIPGNTTLAELMGLGAGYGPALGICLGIGAAAALTLPAAVRCAALLVAGVGQGPVAVGALPASYGTGGVDGRRGPGAGSDGAGAPPRRMSTTALG
ncbi:sensor domain-containing protein [Streptomonospora wellingtoniae]|uniref:Sensor domain-containing protein n=1 Tax=Streptomonospora wellingtoniae TaxID=3075544 RepID=A0ABU2KXK6_9ACTN|nr:sensor domain-containing protein [Streptomonospora sp. DSM 45055]MDT0304037.1 sensor domain-containing protein [Streptomonospora sp. DSM 45055]